VNKLFIALFTPMLLSLGSLQAQSGQNNVLVNMFDWWNTAIQIDGGFTEEGFSRYFTNDAAINVNGKTAVQGVGNMVTHFRKIQKNTDYVEIVLPFEKGFQSGNNIFTHHIIKARETGAVDTSVSHVMGYAVLQNGKIANIYFLDVAISNSLE
tara:strand:- start:1725 stop:2183 length:459 start_codon:yes stop_codon:yes gene_type:complete